VALGVGDSREAAFTLVGPIPAGTWHLVGDGEDITGTVAVRFDVIWRPHGGGADVVVATVNHTFGPPIVPDNASPFATDLTGITVGAAPGDLLVLRFTTTSGSFFVPNGDGTAVNGTDPNLTLPE
jgi:hypothetical protein